MTSTQASTWQVDAGCGSSGAESGVPEDIILRNFVPGNDLTLVLNGYSNGLPYDFSDYTFSAAVAATLKTTASPVAVLFNPTVSVSGWQVTVEAADADTSQLEPNKSYWMDIVATHGPTDDVKTWLVIRIDTRAAVQ